MQTYTIIGQFFSANRALLQKLVVYEHFNQFNLYIVSTSCLSATKQQRTL